MPPKILGNFTHTHTQDSLINLLYSIWIRTLTDEEIRIK